jgi:hypothetical protein
VRFAALLAAIALAAAGCADAGLRAAIADAETEAAAARSGEVDALYAFMRKTHPALFHHNSREVIEAEVARLRERAPHQSWPEYVVGVHRVLKLVGDGHTSVFPFPETGPGFDTRLPLLVEFFGDGTFVVGAEASYRDAVGARLIAIDGHSLEDVYERLESFWPHENAMWVRRWTPLLLRKPGYLVGSGLARNANVAAPITFTVRRPDGAVRDFAVAPVPAATDEAAQSSSWVHAREDAKLARPTALHRTHVPFDFAHLPEQRAVYAVYRQCEDSAHETVAAFAARLFAFVEANNIDRLILDLRENGGGDNEKNEPLLAGLEHSKLNRPGGLFVLIGRQTFSAAQNFATQAERRTQALFVGEPTGSAPNHYGEAKQFTLPVSRLSVIVATKRWQDSAPADARFNLPPDLPAWDKFADYLAGRDAALEAALRYSAPAGAQPFDPRERWRTPREKPHRGD